MKKAKFRVKLIKKIYRDKGIDNVQQKLNMLNDSKMNDAINYIIGKLLFVIILFTLVVIIFAKGYLYAPVVGIISYFLYDYLILETKLKRRRDLLEREALYFFEILTLTLEAGRNLEQALKLTCDNVDSEIAKEFKIALMEISFGKSLLEALETMKKRIPSEIINNIILNIVQTNLFGNSILETMYNQLDFLREKQVFKIREQINKIPNKISIISVLFFIPLIFLLIIGPVIIEMLT